MIITKFPRVKRAYHGKYQTYQTINIGLGSLRENLSRATVTHSQVLAKIPTAQREDATAKMYGIESGTFCIKLLQ